jgi:hypothetical protein
MSMRIFLDDTRPAPHGWVLARWPAEVIALLETGKVEELSLDHDLGDAHRTGYDVLVWIEEAVALRGFRPPVIAVHSANAVGRQRMARAIESIERLVGARARPWPAGKPLPDFKDAEEEERFWLSHTFEDGRASDWEEVTADPRKGVPKR